MILHWWRDRHRAIELTPNNAVEVSFLLLASAYAFLILLKRSIGLLTSLVAIYTAYLWRVRHVPKAESSREDTLISDKVN